MALTRKSIRPIMTLLFTAVILFMCIPAGASDLASGILDGGQVTIREDFAIVVDGETLEPDVPPVERNGVVFIPLRFAAEALHAQVKWYKADKIAQITFPSGKEVKMTVGQNEIDFGETQQILPVSPFIFEGRTMIPLRPTAECGAFRIEEKPNAMLLTSPPDAVEGFTEPGITEIESQDSAHSDAMANIRKKAKEDKITKALKPYVQGGWIIAVLLWIGVAVLRAGKNRDQGWKDMIVILIILTVGVGFIINVLYSTYWAAIVAIGTAIIGLVSTESYEEKLVTMASTAQGFGLICTLFGLGLLIGPAIAERDISAIGYGIYVKIEPTITGLTLSILLNMLYSYEARKMEMQNK